VAMSRPRASPPPMFVFPLAVPGTAFFALVTVVALLSSVAGVKGVAVTRFSAADVVRHPLVERIVRAYDADQAGPKT